MVTPTEAEPTPLPSGDRPIHAFALSAIRPLPQEVDATSALFIDVLAARRSRKGGSVVDGRIGSLLWHATQLRERGFDGRFGRWESRPSPSAGGLHSLHILVLPVDGAGLAGIYLDDRHALGLCGREPHAASTLNATSVAALAGASAGTTLQLIADPLRIASCYEHHETLLWRDAGALMMTLCLVAEALGMTAVPLGRIGTDIVQAFGLAEPVVGLGAVHIGEPAPRCS